ncbi:MAG: RidA family protein [Deltaproteobacteria bacterium]|nr:RidA family protein [Deltaproteobacteria bacterium]MBW1953085.1 RidA family protein [Deltaproteobacteria bacterium]MBW1987182.1 RidA family protein [Deltaproteobacteria bacterium]MBW2135044.1 RidA family protein [Deltaproteobacteria bacterium]
MKKQIISSDQAPSSIGPYSQAVQVGEFIFVSGQIPLDQDGKPVRGDIVVQTIQVLENLKAVLAAAGLSLAHVVKTTVFLADMSDFPEMNRVYAEFFPDNCPARTTVQVAGLPRGVPIEIEAIAYKK